MFGGSGGVKVKSRSRSASNVRTRKRKPKRSVGGNKGNPKCSTKSGRPKLIRRGNSRRKLQENKNKKTLREKKKGSIESKNPIFEPRVEEENRRISLKDNYVYANFIAANKAKACPMKKKKGSSQCEDQEKSPKRSKAKDFLKTKNSSSLSVAQVSESGEGSFAFCSTKKSLLNTSSKSQRNSTLGLKRSSTLPSLQFHISDMSLEQDLGAELGPSEVASTCTSDLSNFVLNLCIEEVPEENEFDSISTFKSLLASKQLPESHFKEVAVPVVNRVSPQIVSEPLSVNDYANDDLDCYLSAYQAYVQENETKVPEKKKSVEKVVKSNVSRCSGCDELHLQSKLVQPENIDDNDDLSDMFYCKECFQEIFGNASYKRALVFKKLRIEKGTQKKDARPVNFVQKSNSSYGGSFGYRKESQGTDCSI